MNKKIIYLLSLIMALSLVFASCKKNGSGDISGPGPGDNGFDNSPTTDTGLADSEEWLNQNSDQPIKNDEIPNFQTTGGVAYFRNPIVVVMGAEKNHVAVFAEKRYVSSGSANDIGVDGSTATDIVCIISKDSGKTWGLPQIVGRSQQAQPGGSDAVASPVVFKVADAKVIVVASAGAGLSRTSQAYNDRNPQSKLMYAVGTYDESTGFTWSSGWQDMTTAAEEAVKTVTAKDNTYKQFGIHSAKGVVVNSGGTQNLYLAVTVANQGSSSAIKEVMGNVIMKGTYSGSGNTVDWSTVNNTAVVFSEKNGTYSSHKASRVIAATGDTDIEYLTVGSPGYGNNQIGYGKAGSDPKDNGIFGSEGSPSYLKIEKWYGQNGYDPTQYSAQNPNKSQRLYAHVKSLNSTITMYALSGDTGFTSTGNTYTVKAYPTDTTTLAKSSSMDVLGDGTIIMAAEQGGSERQYKVVFKRFTQKFLATQLGIN
ncbi:sialidase family protein [Brachyspira pilosicoli]|uniref:sialidase family protein n=1 Tax=Brachyspira pilosicoli TaxID=52584 RepID=UPI003003B89C